MQAIQFPDGHSHRYPCALKQSLLNDPLHSWYPFGQPTSGHFSQRLVGPQAQVCASARLLPAASAASPVVPPTMTRRSASRRLTRRATRSDIVPDLVRPFTLPPPSSRRPAPPPARWSRTDVLPPAGSLTRPP